MPLEEARLNLHLDDPNRLTALVKGHLWAERALNEAISIAADRPEQLRVDRLSFATKVDLAAAFGAIDLEFAELLRKLNSVRNKAAHSLDYDLTDEEVDELVAKRHSFFGDHWVTADDRTELLSKLLHFLAQTLEMVNARNRYDREYGTLVSMHRLLVDTYVGLGAGPAEADEDARKVADPPPRPTLEEIIIPDPAKKLL